jgi:hypothetical protein
MDLGNIDPICAGYRNNAETGDRERSRTVRPAWRNNVAARPYEKSRCSRSCNSVATSSSVCGLGWSRPETIYL